MHNLRERARQLLEDWRQVRARHPRAFAVGLFSLSFLAAFSIGSGVWFLSSLVRDLPDETAISRIGDMDQATSVYDRHDNFAFTIFKEQRIEAPLAQVSPHLIGAIIAIEDQRFLQHRGFDIVRIASATIANLRHRRAVQGGSTITQQLARQSFLKVYFGDGLYGAEAASRGYFGKHALQLTVAEAAMLAGFAEVPLDFRADREPREGDRPAKCRAACDARERHARSRRVAIGSNGPHAASR